MSAGKSASNHLALKEWNNKIEPTLRLIELYNNVTITSVIESCRSKWWHVRTQTLYGIEPYEYIIYDWNDDYDGQDEWETYWTTEHNWKRRFS